MNSQIIRCFSKILKLTAVLFTIVSSINRVFGQTVTIDNNNSGVTSKYTFEYTLTQPTNGANVFVLEVPAGYSNFIDPGSETQDKGYLELYVNNQLNTSNWGISSIWSRGVQISLSTIYPVGSNIKVVVKDGIITNPSNGAYTFNWKTSTGQGNLIESFSKQVTVGKGTITVVNTGGASLNSGWTF